MKKWFALLLLITTALWSGAQIVVNNLGDNTVQFSALLPPLHQVAGAPVPFYTYFWEFGDGTFSDAIRDGDKPRHRYKTSGPYDVRLLATNNYDNGRSTSFTKQIVARASTGMNEPSGFFDKNDLNKNMKLKVNRHPRAEEELVAYLGYRNRRSDDFAGSLVVFFNDQRFLRRSFRLREKRTYYGEERSSFDRLSIRTPDPEMTGHPLASRESGGNHAGSFMQAGADNFYDYPSGTSSMLHVVKKNYLDNTVIHFNSIPKGEERFVFMSMDMLPEMIRDTNAAVTMTAMMIPDNPALPSETFSLEIQIVASHDPNRMLLKQNPINYRFMRKNKELTYKVQFQNTGAGAANNISVGIALPNQFNTATLQVTGVSPVSASCKVVAPGQSCMDTIRTADSIHFYFRNIYLPGMKQNLVSHEDSTQGFVEYAIRFKKRPKKLPFSSRAVIQFDRNEPVITNKATARFVKGFSPGIMAGYNVSLSSGKYSAKGPVQIGYVLAPYSPYRPYFQVEAHAGLLQQENSTEASYTFNTDEIRKKFNIPSNVEIDGKGPNGRGSRQEITLSKIRNELQVVPLQLRYNFSDWIGFGVGVMSSIPVSEQIKTTEKDSLKLFAGSRRFDTAMVRKTTSKTTWFRNVWTESDIALLADLQIGRVRRTGPALGLRYYRQLRGNIPNRFFVYIACKL